MMRLHSSRSASSGRTQASPRAASFSGYTSLATSHLVPVSPSFRKPRRTASAATTSAMWSQGSGDRPSKKRNAWWMVLSGQMRNRAPVAASFRAESSISSATPAQSPRVMHAS